jgi:hypothetical protein
MQLVELLDAFCHDTRSKLGAEIHHVANYRALARAPVDVAGQLQV